MSEGFPNTEFFVVISSAARTAVVLYHFFLYRRASLFFAIKISEYGQILVASILSGKKISLVGVVLCTVFFVYFFLTESQPVRLGLHRNYPLEL